MRSLLFIFLLGITCTQAAIITDDTSGMHRTIVKEIVVMRVDQTPQDLQKILLELEPGTPVTVRGTRHSQGGHSIAPGGLILDLSHWKQMQFLSSDVLRVGAGALWKDVIEYANEHAQSVAIMQSDYDFSVGGSLSTNVHGWSVGRPPLIDSVVGFHLMTAAGEILYCSRENNHQLFSATIGGYGLFGIILSVDLRLVPNNLYQLHHPRVKNEAFLDLFKRKIATAPAGSLFFARPRLDRAHYMEDISVWYFTPLPGTSARTPLQERKAIHKAARFFFSQTASSDFFRTLRWKVESSQTLSKLYSRLPRNTLLYHSTVLYTQPHSSHQDLLQEYFVPERHFQDFYQFLQKEVPELKDMMLNLTIRHVGTDDTSILRYAGEPMFCFVLFLRGSPPKEFDAKLGNVARRCITKAQSLGGTYYLPYRPYATQDQFNQSYPTAEAFKDLKRYYDPHEVFSNHFYQTYLK